MEKNTNIRREEKERKKIYFYQENIKKIIENYEIEK